jgi:glutamate-1-semialdehyde 2,1-aminomutase
MDMVRLVSSGTEAGMSALRLARGYTGRNKIIKFNGCYHGHADALLVKAGSGLATFGASSSAGVPADVAKDTIVLEYNDVAQLEEAFAKMGSDIACVIMEPIAGNMNFVRASVDFTRRIRELTQEHGALLIYDEVMTGFRVALGSAQACTPRRSRLCARHHRDGQGHRRRHAHGGLRRPPRDHGKALAAGPGLPGRHAVGQPDCHGLRPEDAGADQPPRLPRRAAPQDRPPDAGPEGRSQCRRHSLQRGLARRPVRLLFPARAAHDYAEVMKTDGKVFNKFYHGMLERGHYFAPALYEAGFVSAAHSDEDIDRTIEAAREVFKTL